MRARQLPAVDNEGWVGESIPESGLERPYINFVVWGNYDPANETDVTGLIVDEWNETIPDTAQLTGITFHFDTPATEPPQAVLIAVPPRLDVGEWTTDTLQKILLETLDLAKIRSVGRRELEKTISGQLIPAVYLAEGAEDRIASTDLFERG